MRLVYSLLLLLFFQIAGWSQSAISSHDLSSIQTLVRDGRTYEQLLKRMQMTDPSLTTDDYRIIYYGYQFTDEYHGSMDTIHYYVGNLVDQGKTREAFNASRKALTLNPVSLRLLLYCIQTGRELGMSREELAPFTKPFVEMTYVISLSGDGIIDRTAFKVISIQDEYVMMQFYFGITDIKDQNFMEHNGRAYDYFNITPTEEFKYPVIYFDITPSMAKMSEVYGYEE